MTTRMQAAGGASTRLRRLWFRVLGGTLNRLTLRLARAGRGPFTIVRHVGRKSGIVRETPIIAQPLRGDMVIELTYGPDVQWFKNVEAAGGCELIRGRRVLRVTAVEPLPAAEALQAFPAPERLILRLLRRHDFRRLVVGGPGAA